jgi:DNA mismatch repair ATPase MutL
VSINIFVLNAYWLDRSTQPIDDDGTVPVVVKGLISKFSIGGGRTGTDRQFFYVNGRPCNLTKVCIVLNIYYCVFAELTAYEDPESVQRSLSFVQR